MPYQTVDVVVVAVAWKEEPLLVVWVVVVVVVVEELFVAVVALDVVAEEARLALLDETESDRPWNELDVVVVPDYIMISNVVLNHFHHRKEQLPWQEELSLLLLLSLLL